MIIGGVALTSGDATGGGIPCQKHGLGVSSKMRQSAVTHGDDVLVGSSISCPYRCQCRPRFRSVNRLLGTSAGGTLKRVARTAPANSRIAFPAMSASS